MTLYVILGLAAAALYFVIRSDAENDVRADTAEAKVTEITQVVKDANTIEANNATLTDAELDDKLHARSNN